MSRDVLCFGDLKQFLKSNELCGLEEVLVRFADPQSPHGGPFPPSDFHSWRGSYELAAFGSNDKPVLVRDFVKMIARAQMVTHQGWKGGDYDFYDRTTIWYGEEGETHSGGRSEGEEENEWLYLGLGAIVLEGPVVYLEVHSCPY